MVKAKWTFKSHFGCFCKWLIPKSESRNWIANLIATDWIAQLWAIKSFYAHTQLRAKLYLITSSQKCSFQCQNFALPGWGTSGWVHYRHLPTSKATPWAFVPKTAWVSVATLRGNFLPPSFYCPPGSLWRALVFQQRRGLSSICSLCVCVLMLETVFVSSSLWESRNKTNSSPPPRPQSCDKL